MKERILAFIENLGRIDSRIVYALVFLATAIPLIMNIRIPMPVSPEVKSAFQAMDRLKPGDVILISTDYGPSSAPETQPMLEAILTHAFKKDLKVLLMTHWRFEGLIMGIQGLDKIAKKFGKEYGKDYLVLGYRPGVTAVMIGMSKDFRNIFSTDNEGKPLDSYPMYKEIAGDDGILNYKDIKLLVGLEAGDAGNFWIMIVNARYGVPMIMGTTAVITPEYFTFYQSRQIEGLLGGLKGAADYEALLGISGFASRGMVSQFAVHVLIILLIFLGNLSDIARRFRS